jgi:DNA processing protein
MTLSPSDTEAGRRLWLRLHCARGVGGVKVAGLLAAFTTAEAIFAADRESLEQIGGRSGLFDAIHDPELEARVDCILEDLSRIDLARVLTPADDEYPKRLRRSHSVPAVLFVRGRLDALLPAAAVVGSRRARAERARVTSEWCRAWAEAGVSVVSGLAQGIDAAAHRGALAGLGHTVAVLGTGLDRTYPSLHAALLDRILASGGAVVTQFAPHTRTFPGCFPARNVTLAGLADAVVIMQAAGDSGALHTAQAALESARPVLVAPSDLADRENAGGLGLLRTRACAIGAPDDLLALLHVESHGPKAPPPPALPPDLAAVVAGLDFCGKSLDELTRELNLPAATILNRLLSLELAGVVARQPGPRYVRTR